MMASADLTASECPMEALAERRSSQASSQSDQWRERSARPRGETLSLFAIKDRFCWDCHKSEVDFSCQACLRSYHHKCSSLKRMADADHDHLHSPLCPECMGIERAEDRTNPSSCMQMLNNSVDQLAELLIFAIETIRTADKNGFFIKAVSREEYPEYHNLIVNPMSLSVVEENIHKKLYASTNSFLADIKWIYHNCVIFNSGVNNRLISAAKNVIRVAKQECEEIEICPDCYRNYYTLDEETYFAAVCRRPHAIVWAKLNGHPFWPAKVVRYNAFRNEVDVRFFGTHDKCWLKPDKCYLMSQNYPMNKKPSKFDQNKFDSAIRDMNMHLDELDRHFKGLFQFHEKQSHFTTDKLYLTSNESQTPKENGRGSGGEVKAVSPKPVLHNVNGTPFKKLKVRVSPFDVVTNIEEANPQLRRPSPPSKRMRRNFMVPTKAKTKCMSSAIPVRQELSSSFEESEASLCGSRCDSELDVSLAPHRVSTCDRPLADNHSTNGATDRKSLDSAKHSQTSPIVTQTVTVSGKSSQILNLNQSIDSPKRPSSDSTDQKPRLGNAHDSSPRTSDKSTELSNRNVAHLPLPHRIGNFINMQKVLTNDELMKKVKSLEFKNRKLTEELAKAGNRVALLEEEKDELKKTNRELLHSIDDIKRKQWCINCLKEAILPCCWNTCYCTVECQHQHWPVHAKTCRRRQTQSRT